MARTISEIQAAIAAARAARPELAALTSPSAVAIYSLIEYLVAVAQWAQETLWDRFKADVDATIAAAPAGTVIWYAEQALLFQLDDTLIMLPTGKEGYAVPVGPADPKRIVVRATAKENDETGRLFIKVAQAGPTPGTLAAIVDSTLPGGPKPYTQVRAYLKRRGFAGTRFELVSREADRLQVTGNIYYDPLLNLAALQAAVIAAIENYLANLEFDGQVYVARLEDAIQAVPGVKDVQLVRVAARTGTAAATVVVRVYETAAGYVVVEETPGYTLADTLTFLPYGA